MFRTLLTLACAASLTGHANAQTSTGSDPSQSDVTAPSTQAADLTPREAYQQGRARLDELMKSRSIVEAVTVFDPDGAINQNELKAMEANLRVRFPQDFEHAALVRSELLRNGFRQELIAYWTGDQYLYVYLLLHTFEQRTRLLNFAYNSSFEKLQGNF